MEAFVYSKACIQCGLCPGICPTVFSLEPGQSAQAKEGKIPQEEWAAVQEAADSCPAAAIEVRP